MRELLASRPRPTAVVVANVATAVGALSAIWHSGLRVPGDVSLVAIHDIPLASHLWPALTTVRMPLEEPGRAGLQALANDDSTGTTVVRRPTELISRESTAAPPAGRR